MIPDIPFLCEDENGSANVILGTSLAAKPIRDKNVEDKILRLGLLSHPIWSMGHANALAWTDAILVGEDARNVPVRESHGILIWSLLRFQPIKHKLSG